MAGEHEDFRQNFNNIELSAFEARQRFGSQSSVIGVVRSSLAIKPRPTRGGGGQDLLVQWTSTQVLLPRMFSLLHLAPNLGEGGGAEEVAPCSCMYRGADTPGMLVGT